MLPSAADRQLGRNGIIDPQFVEYPIATGGEICMSTTIRRRSKELRNRIPGRRIPTLAEMIRDGQASHAKIRRSTQEALIEWLCPVRTAATSPARIISCAGDRFRDFARRIGIDRSSAFQLVKLHRHRAAIMSRCLDEQERATARGEPYTFPGWETALGWFEQRGHHHTPKVTWQHGSDEWETPRALFAFLDWFFRFDVDVCASSENAKCRQFFSKDQNGLSQTWRAGRTYWMNAPYSEAGKWAKKAAVSKGWCRRCWLIRQSVINRWYVVT